ncbi:MAG: hypothetical protein IH608_01015 [Proteobacteria bacterium]|nr:hypothetical protein [Pseudomonadota bacterium]
MRGIADIVRVAPVLRVNTTAVSLMLERHRSRREDVAWLLLGILGTQLWDHLFRRGPLSTRAIGA